MAWTLPRTWTTGELVTAAIMNIHVRDNFNATSVALVTTKGDITPATGASALARLGVGTNNQSLIADSACNVGMKWGGGVGWSPFNPPATANGYDDEFADASLSASWTEWDVPSVVTVSETSRGLEIVAGSTSTACFAGIFKDAPASPYTVWSYIQQDINLTLAGGQRGLVFGACMGACPNTSDIYVFTMNSAACSITFDRYNSYQTDGGVAIAAYSSSVFQVGGVFMRLRYANQSASADISRDGLSWRSIGASAINFAPSNIGLFVWHSPTGATSSGSTRMFVPFFRVISGSLYDTVMEGGR